MKFTAKFLILIIFLLNFNLAPVFAQAEEPAATPAKKEELNFQDKVKLLIPSQESLFDNSRKLDLNQDGIIDKNEQVRLADGDLEQGLAPRILQLIVNFSGIALVILFTAGGIKLLLARGDEEALTQTKELIVQTIIGTVLITASFGIVLGIINLFNSL